MFRVCWNNKYYLFIHLSWRTFLTKSVANNCVQSVKKGKTRALKKKKKIGGCGLTPKFTARLPFSIRCWIRKCIEVRNLEHKNMQCAMCNMQHAKFMQHATSKTQKAICNKQHATYHATWSIEYGAWNFTLLIAESKWHTRVHFL